MKLPSMTAVLCAGLLLSAAASRSAAVQDAGVDAPPPVERLSMPGLTNLAHVEGGIYRGGRPLLDQGGMDSLHQLGIKNIINLQGGDLTSPKMVHLPDWSKIVLKSEPGEAPGLIALETSDAQEEGITDASIPLDSLAPITPDEAADLERILGMIAAATPQNPIYVHCEHGKDRTGLVFALYRMRADGWSQAKASAEMTEMGHTGTLDKLFTGNMDLKHVLPLFPELALPPAPPLKP